MIEVREAVDTAQRYVHDLFPAEAEDIRLEEVELAQGDSGPEWQVTLSFYRRGDATPGGLVGQLVGPSVRRHYKTFIINAGDRQVRAMKIRQVQP